MPEDHVSHAASRDFESHGPGPCCETNAEAASLDLKRSPQKKSTNSSTDSVVALCFADEN